MSEAKSQADNTGNPAPLGLIAFGMTTMLLNFHNAGFFPLDTMVLAMGIFYGGLAQILVGIMEWKKGNTFGVTAFTSYGFFWLSFVAMLVMPSMKVGVPGPEVGGGFASFLLMWGIFTFGLFFATLKINRALQIVFALLTILFFLLALGAAADSAGLKLYAGWVGLLCGASAIYAGLAQVLNETYGRIVWPLCPVKKK